MASFYRLKKEKGGHILFTLSPNDIRHDHIVAHNLGSPSLEIKHYPKEHLDEEWNKKDIDAKHEDARTALETNHYHTDLDTSLKHSVIINATTVKPEGYSEFYPNNITKKNKG
ncbi:MAG: hypothetical protein NTZ44_02960 [Candidatus Nomurabacteria bacterium]|nr:hypothetical protein [Candidatus Nomurabacteria bacterium]